MDRPVGAALRWTRAVLLAAVAMLAGLVAHLSAGGLLPGRTALLALFAVCTLAAASLLGRPASTLRVVLLLMAGQTFIHGALTAMSGHKGDPPLSRASLTPTPPPHLRVGTGGGRRSGSLYEQFYANRPAAVDTHLTIPAPVQHLMADFTGQHAAMALGHLAAAASLGWWLAMGERALWTLAALMYDGVRELARPLLVSSANAAMRLVTLISTSLQLTRTPPDPGGRSLALPRPGRFLVRSVVRRGPPALLAA